MKQKEIFLAGEGNAWFNRNSEDLTKQRLPDSDPLLVDLLSLKEQFDALQGGVSVLEVGCGSGARLDWLQRNMGVE